MQKHLAGGDLLLEWPIASLGAGTHELHRESEVGNEEAESEPESEELEENEESYQVEEDERHYQDMLAGQGAVVVAGETCLVHDWLGGHWSHAIVSTTHHSSISRPLFMADNNRWSSMILHQ